MQVELLNFVWWKTKVTLKQSRYTVYLFLFLSAVHSLLPTFSRVQRIDLFSVAIAFQPQLLLATYFCYMHVFTLKSGNKACREEDHRNEKSKHITYILSFICALCKTICCVCSIMYFCGQVSRFFIFSPLAYV
jgi:hypothetical protein